MWTKKHGVIHITLLNDGFPIALLAYDQETAANRILRSVNNLDASLSLLLQAETALRQANRSEDHKLIDQITKFVIRTQRHDES